MWYHPIAKDLQVAAVAGSRLIRELRQAGLRATAPRRAVIGVLEASREHLSAEDIHRVLAADGVRIDLSSVYRTLTLLVRLGLVRLVGPCERHGHFEVRHREQVHLVCSRCGAVIEADLGREGRFDDAVATVARKHGFRLSEFTIEVGGTCAACRRADGRSPDDCRRARGRQTARITRDFRRPLRPPKRDFGTSWPAKAEVAPTQ